MNRFIIAIVSFVLLSLFGCKQNSDEECFVPLDCGEGFLCVNKKCVPDIKEEKDETSDISDNDYNPDVTEGDQDNEISEHEKIDDDSLIEPDESPDDDSILLNGFIAHYFSNWKPPFIHFNDTTGTAWKTREMKPEEESWFVYHHDIWTGTVTFVFTDGKGTWDNPNQVSTENYVSTVKEFWVKSGKVYNQKP